jgi:2-polyprenyl-6-methoxyphenol hydroxylase-like FAD-dependent oxidoreductase
MSVDVDVVTVGGGLGGSALAGVLARNGKRVFVLERETQFKDRVRGENILPWGVAAGRRLGIVDDLMAGGGRAIGHFNWYAMGQLTDRRPLAMTTPHGEESINIYHPDLQEGMLASAVKAGAEVKRGVPVQGISEQGGQWTVSYIEDGKQKSLTARLVVGADGRFSKMREWAGFEVERDPDFLRIAGLLVEGSSVPDDTIHFCVGPGVATFIAPHGKGRARMYVCYVGAMGDRKLTGKDKLADFIASSLEAGAPREWYDGIEATGPLAEFESSDSWVRTPGKRGVALVGDAAWATNPCWGNGLSKTLLDVEALSRCLLATDDWDAAAARYGAEHADYAGKLHDILSWMTELVWTGGPEADARRMKVFPAMKLNPMAYPDAIGMGPFGPCDETARRLLLGLD